MKHSKKAVTRLIAEVLAGTQVPRSLGMLGAATKPWDELRDVLKVNGWVKASEIETALQRALEEPKS